MTGSCLVCGTILNTPPHQLPEVEFRGLGEACAAHLVACAPKTASTVIGMSMLFGHVLGSAGLSSSDPLFSKTRDQARTMLRALLDAPAGADLVQVIEDALREVPSSCAPTTPPATAPRIEIPRLLPKQNRN